MEVFVVSCCALPSPKPPPLKGGCFSEILIINISIEDLFRPCEKNCRSEGEATEESHNQRLKKESLRSAQNDKELKDGF